MCQYKYRKVLKYMIELEENKITLQNLMEKLKKLGDSL